MSLDWAYIEIKIPCVFFCHKQHILHNSSCAILLKNGMVISQWKGVQKNVRHWCEFMVSETKMGPI